MKAEYIFIKKPQGNPDLKDSNKLFQSMFKAIFVNVTFDTFQINIKNKLQTVYFKSSNGKEGVVYLTLSIIDKPALCAEVLSQVNDSLLSGAHRKDFYIINSYDESSAYFCEKLAPRFGKFERLMRSFIYISLTRSLGIDWFQKTFTEEIKTELKDKGNISDTVLIERGLYEMTFAQLYDFLFKEFSYYSVDTIIYNELLSKDLKNMDKTEIIDKLVLCQKKSLWDRFFSSTDFNLEKYLKDMRDYRNKVAHNKFVKLVEFKKCKKDLHKINSTLENAIEQLNNNTYTERHLTDTIMSFVALFGGFMKDNYDVFANAQKNFSALGKVIVKAFEPYASITKMTALYNLGSGLANLQKTLSALDVISNQQNCLPILDAANSKEFNINSDSISEDQS